MVFQGENKCWQRVAEDGREYRTIHCLKMKYKNMKRRDKVNYASNKQEIKKTDEGTVCSDIFSSIDSQLIDILGNQATGLKSVRCDDFCKCIL